MDKVAELRKPVIAAVRGFAFGGGTEISLMCEMIIADSTGRFGLTEVTLGVTPGGGTGTNSRLGLYRRYMPSSHSRTFVRNPTEIISA